MCGLGLGTVEEMLEGRKFCSSGLDPFPATPVSQPSCPAVGEPRGFTLDLRDSQAQDCCMGLHKAFAE